MSNISRRDFMKTAGVMTLAVAASAALAGCTADAADTSSETVNSTTTSFSMGDTCTFGKAHNTVTVSTKFYTAKDHAGDFYEGNDVLYAAIKVKVAAGSETSTIIDYLPYLPVLGTEATIGKDVGSRDLTVTISDASEDDEPEYLATAPTDEADAAVLAKIQADSFVSGTMYASADALKEGTVGDPAVVGGNEGYVVVKLTCTKATGHYYASKIAVKFTNTIYTETKDGVTFSTSVPTSGNVIYFATTNAADTESHT